MLFVLSCSFPIINCFRDSNLKRIFRKSYTVSKEYAKLPGWHPGFPKSQLQDYMSVSKGAWLCRDAGARYFCVGRAGLLLLRFLERGGYRSDGQPVLLRIRASLQGLVFFSRSFFQALVRPSLLTH